MGAFKRLFLFMTLLTPAVAFAAEGGHYSVSGFVWRIFMFVAFAGLLFWLLKDRIKSMMGAGVTNMVKSMSDAEKALVDSEQELADYRAMLAGMNDELELMRKNARATAEKEAKTLVYEAEKMAEKYRLTTINMIDAELEKAKKNLCTELMLRAVDEAEELLSKDTDTTAKKKYIEDSIKELGVNR